MVLILATIGCAISNPLTRAADDLPKTSELWADVPRMDGLELSEIETEMPLFAKLLLQTALNRMSAGGGSTGAWIIFKTDKTAEDIKAFYTNDLMAENGWDPSETSTCVEGSAQGVTEAGVFCVFQKDEGTHYSGLMVIGGLDAETQKTNVIFIRVEADQTPTPHP